MSISRRQMLAGIAGFVAVANVDKIVPSSAFSGEKMERFAQQGGDFSWKPHKLDIKEVEDVAYEGYYHKGYGCAYGTFYSIIGLLAEKYGAPYNTFPFSCLEFSKSAVGGFGGTCGALIGGALALSLFYPRKEATPLQNELFRWYEVTALPIYQPDDAIARIGGPLEQEVSDSILCHISVARWSEKTGLPAESKQRSERCGRITSDVAKKTAEILFAKMDGTFTPVLTSSDLQKSCRDAGCHGGTDDFARNTLKGKMDCQPCHTGTSAVLDKTKEHY